jgi:hypothetical protein
MDMNTEFKTGAGTGGIGEVLQANWLPLSVIGVGVAWLVASNTGLAGRVAQDERVQAAGRKIGEIAGELVPTFDLLSANQKCALVDMAYNLGVGKLAAKFPNLIEACRRGDQQLVISIQAKLIALLTAVFPNISGRALKLINQMLPAPTGSGGAVLAREFFFAGMPRHRLRAQKHDIIGAGEVDSHEEMPMVHLTHDDLLDALRPHCNPPPAPGRNTPRGVNNGRSTTLAPRTPIASPAVSGGACCTASKLTREDS